MTNPLTTQVVRETSSTEHTQRLDLSVDLAPNNPYHLLLANPVMIASGTFGYDGYGRGITKDMDKKEKLKVLRKEYSRWNALTNNSDKAIRERAREMRDLAANIRRQYT